jgi:dual specificity phosphatase 12
MGPPVKALVTARPASEFDEELRALFRLSQQRSEVANLITDKVWLGSAFAASDAAFLRSNGITAIVNVAEEVGDRSAEAKAAGVAAYYFLPMKDEEWYDPTERVGEALRAVKEAVARGQTVLVHCFHGVSRSALVVNAYVMDTLGLSARAALQHVRARRGVSYPNRSFCKWLTRREAAPSIPEDAIENLYGSTC